MASARSLLRLALAAAIVASATAAAGTYATGQLTLTSLRSDGQADVEAGLLALYRLDQLQSDVAPDASFRASGAEVRVVTYESDPAVANGDTWVAPVPPGYQPNETTYQDARVTSGEGQTRAQFKFNVVAAPGSVPTVRLSSACARMTAPDRNEFEAWWMIQAPTEPVKADVSRSIQYAECASSTLEVEGDFTVVLFEVDALLETKEQVVELRSGVGPSSVLPDPVAGAAEGAAAHMRQQYLYVTGGRIVLKLDSAPHFVYLQDPSVDLDGSLTLMDAAGQLDHDGAAIPIQASRLTVDGQLHGSLTHADAPLQLGLTGDIDSVDADGEPVLLASTATSSSPPWPGLAAGAAALLLVLVIAGVVLRRRSATALLGRVAVLPPTEAKRVVDLCNKALLRNAGLGRAYYFRARALTSLGDFTAARQDLLDAWHHMATGDRLRSPAALQAAAVAQLLGDERERDDWLHRAGAPTR